MVQGKTSQEHIQSPAVTWMAGSWVTLFLLPVVCTESAESIPCLCASLAGATSAVLCFTHLSVFTATLRGRAAVPLAYQ